MAMFHLPLRQVLFFLSPLLVIGCTAKPQINDFVLLPDEIRETSGLICLENGNFITINDSGNSSELFEFDRSGRILQRVGIPVKNIDWEALAQSPTHLWIGDIGNNSGNRNQTQVWQLNQPWSQPQQPSAINVRLPDFPTTAPEPYQHDFDAEAITFANGALWLFSKSWLSNNSQVYKIDVDQRILKAGAITGLSGLVTDAAFSESEQLFVLVGYANMRKNPLQFILYHDYQPFIALVNTDLTLIAQRPIQSKGQVEAVCIDRQQQIWLTQEQTERQPALFWRFGSIEQLKIANIIKS